MQLSQNYRIVSLNWQSPMQAQLKAIRLQVFIVEQQVPVHMEWDEYDKDALHLLVLDTQDQAIGCARVILNKALNQAKLGRMAVLKHCRGQGLGGMLLDEAVHICQLRQYDHILLSAQTHATSFYEKAGFNVVSEPYADAHIPHVDMLLKL